MNLVVQEPVVADDMVKDVSSHVRIHCTQRVVQQIHLGILIHGPSKAVQ